MEVEAKKMRREVVAMEKELAAMRVSRESDQRPRRPSAQRGACHCDVFTYRLDVNSERIYCSCICSRSITDLFLLPFNSPGISETDRASTQD
ncbi:Microtubule-associated protein 70-3, partial [Cucurbita argyrosperma subsp. argyrosperma]